MAEKIVLRCQFKGGQRKVVNGLTKASSASQFQEELFALTGVAPHRQRILFGFPPKELSLVNSEKTIDELSIKSGDTVIVEENRKAPKVVENSNGTGSEAKVPRLDSSSDISAKEETNKLRRHIVPADNSCLFTSISYLMHNGDKTFSDEIRTIAAQCVLSDPEHFTEVVLGKPNAQYYEWILNHDHWGGAIEIRALSKYFQIEIDVVDIQSGRIDQFGQDESYPNRIFLIYDGIHYDPLAGFVKTIFPVSDEATYAEALILSKDAREKRQFTDLAKFTLRCLSCQKTLTGQADAQSHAKSTGHTNFGEL